MHIYLFLDGQDFIHKFPNSSDIMEWYLCTVMRFVFVILAIGSLMRDYFFESIFCWIPFIWTPAYDEFTRNFCWTQNTYVHPIDRIRAPSPAETRGLEINYYQWVPLILLALLVPLELPALVWKVAADYLDLDLNGLASIMDKFHQKERNLRRRTLQYLVKLLDLLIERRAKEKKAVQKNHRHTFLVLLFFVVKLLVMLVFVGELWLVQKFLGAAHWTYGLDFLDFLRRSEDSGVLGSNMTTLDSASHTGGIFPLVTWCRLPIKSGGDHYSQHVVCLLPSNVFNVRIFTLVWFVFVAGLGLGLADLFVWVWRILGPGPSGRGSLGRHLAQESNRAAVKEFMSEHGGVSMEVLILLHHLRFCLRDEVLMCEISVRLYRHWLRQRPEEPDAT